MMRLLELIVQTAGSSSIRIERSLITLVIRSSRPS